MQIKFQTYSNNLPGQLSRHWFSKAIFELSQKHLFPIYYELVGQVTH